MAVEWVLLSSDRFTDEERRRIEAHRCTYQTGFGLPHIEYCPNVLPYDQYTHGRITCNAHEAVLLANGVRVLRIPIFDMYANTPPEGDWAYEVDDFGVIYGPGWWPFYRENTTSVRESTTSVRFAPKTKYYAWGNMYVTAYPTDRDPALIQARTTLYVAKRGAGADVIPCLIMVNLRTGEITIPTNIPAELREQAHDRGSRLLSAIMAARKERRQGKAAPTTAHERYKALKAAEASTAPSKER